MKSPIDTLIRRVHRAVMGPGTEDQTDGQLLASFIEQHDESAFGALVRRHAPMVWSVCRRVVGHHHDAEDAFQATFLVLARRASSVRPSEGIANWLYGVALRTARKAKGTAAKRWVREKQVPEMPDPPAVQQEEGREHPLLTQELNGLPANYRLPILLCDLEGKAIKEAARQLGWPQGTVAGRLARGRKLLAERLAKRGMALPAGSLAVAASQASASAGVPASLMSNTAKAAMLLVSGRAGAGVIPEAVAVLMEAVMKSMMRSKLSKIVAGLMVLGAVAFGGAVLTDRTTVDQPAKREQVDNKPAIDRPAPLERHNEPEEKPGPAKTDLDQLQGGWSVVSFQHGEGIKITKQEIIFMVDGKRASLQDSDGGLEGGLYLDPASNPKTFDLAMSKNTIEGIYSLDGDTLRLCYDIGYPGTNRPAGFTIEKDKSQVLLVLKRTYGPEIFPLFDGTRAFPKLIELMPSPEDLPARGE